MELRKELLEQRKKPTISRHEMMMNLLSEWLNMESEENEISFTSSRLENMIEDLDSYDQKLLEELIQALKTISTKRNLVAYRICEMLLMIYDKFEDSRKIIMSCIDDNDDQIKRWTPYLQHLKIKTTLPNEESKKILIKSILDNNENPIIRRGLLDTVMENFSNDDEVIKVNSRLLSDVELLDNVASYMEKYPDELKNNLSNIVTLCNKKECVKNYGSLNRLLRKYISTIQK